jgi:leader peptidase (prepilin peptidase)/N-methyltransferase
MNPLDLLTSAMPVVTYLVVFVVGACVGSFLNVCIYRIPYEKSLFWPGSRCGKCFQPIPFRYNVPLLSYWLLRGRCRSCGARFSVRYFLIELLTGLGFAGLYHLEVVANVQRVPLFASDPARFFIAHGVPPWQCWVFFAYHAALLALLIVTALTDIDHLEIPLPITLFGMVVGLAGSVLLPWPWPNPPPSPGEPLPALPPTGLYPWPVWYWRHPEEFPAWLQPGSHLLGLLTGLAGLLAGLVVLRAIAFLFKVGRGKEGMGIGDADLMMMVGSFLGWQVVVVSFFVAVLPALVFGVVQLVLRGEKPMPFGPSLALGTLITWLGWHWIGPTFAPYLFEPLILAFLGVGGSVGLFVISWLLWLVRGPDQPAEGGGETA